MCNLKLEQEFEEFFVNCEKINKQEFIQTLKPLKIQLLKKKFKYVSSYILLLATICFAISYFDIVNWYFCALFRIIMIQLLPLWNWTHLANAKCLIPKATTSMKSYEEGAFTLSKKDCRVCEHFDTIDVHTGSSYETLYNKFLIRGLPVILPFTSPASSKSETVIDFINRVTQNMNSMVKEEACSLETNLMIQSYATVEKTFSVLREFTIDSPEMPWFLSFRNCNFKALKASRLMIHKPHFYPRNRPAPSSSWILLSQNYKNHENELSLYGLIIVTQMKGVLGITLKAKESCQNICRDLTIELFAGESLMFLSNLWTFTYEYIAEKNFTLTFITETDFY